MVQFFFTIPKLFFFFLQRFFPESFGLQKEKSGSEHIEDILILNLCLYAIQNSYINTVARFCCDIIHACDGGDGGGDGGRPCGTNLFSFLLPDHVLGFIS